MSSSFLLDSGSVPPLWKRIGPTCLQSLHRQPFPNGPLRRFRSLSPFNTLPTTLLMSSRSPLPSQLFFCLSDHSSVKRARQSALYMSLRAERGNLLALGIVRRTGVPDRVRGRLAGHPRQRGETTAPTFTPRYAGAAPSVSEWSLSQANPSVTRSAAHS